MHLVAGTCMIAGVFKYYLPVSDISCTVTGKILMGTVLLYDVSCECFNDEHRVVTTLPNNACLLPFSALSECVAGIDRIFRTLFARRNTADFDVVAPTMVRTRQYLNNLGCSPNAKRHPTEQRNTSFSWPGRYSSAFGTAPSSMTKYVSRTRIINFCTNLFFSRFVCLLEYKECPSNHVSLQSIRKSYG